MHHVKQPTQKPTQSAIEIYHFLLWQDLDGQNVCDDVEACEEWSEDRSLRELKDSRLSSMVHSLVRSHHMQTRSIQTIT